MIVYVCVPINGRKVGTLEEKKMAAKKQSDRIKSILQKRGHAVITPFDIVPIEEDIDDAEALGRCITALRRCDAIYKASGWRFSNGCQVESVTAQVYNIKVLEDEI